jgi:hypothetical protein
MTQVTHVIRFPEDDDGRVSEKKASVPLGTDLSLVMPLVEECAKALDGNGWELTGLKLEGRPINQDEILMDRLEDFHRRCGLNLPRFERQTVK